MSFSYSEYFRTGPATFGATSTVICSSSNTEKMYLRNIILYNASGNTETVVMYTVPQGAVPGYYNQIYQLTLASKETRVIDYNQPGIVLATGGDSIHASGGNISGYVTITINGIIEF